MAGAHLVLGAPHPGGKWHPVWEHIACSLVSVQVQSYAWSWLMLGPGYSVIGVCGVFCPRKGQNIPSQFRKTVSAAQDLTGIMICTVLFSRCYSFPWNILIPVVQLRTLTWRSSMEHCSWAEPRLKSSECPNTRCLEGRALISLPSFS